MPPPAPDILLTGASGFLGPYVTDALTAAGHRIRAASRTQLSGTLFSDVALIRSLSSATDWSEALSGDIKTIVHLAGLAHRNTAFQAKESALYHETNVAATLALAQAAAAAGAEHFIFASSIAVNGSSTTGQTIFRESDEPAPKTVYGESKARAEAGLRDLARLTGLRVTAIRPPMIYGRGAKGSFHTLSHAIRRRLPLPFRSIQNIRAFVAAENVANFIAFAASHPPKGFEAVIVADDEQVSTSDFCRRIGRAASTPALLLPVPEIVLTTTMCALGASGLIDSALGSLRVDTSKALRMGWQPAFTMDQALQRAIGHDSSLQRIRTH